MIHGHGDNHYQFSAEVKADFSSNVRVDGCPVELIEFLKERLHLINHYPEPDGESLRELIARKHDVLPSQVILCNGTSDGFYQLAQAFAGANSAILSPSFSEYEDACSMFQHRLSFFKNEEFESCSFDGAGLVWLGNPNNPDGHIFQLEQICQKLYDCPNTVFVVDEAYESLSCHCDSTLKLINQFENLVVCRSLTKSFGIPGIRLGYLIAGKQISSKLNHFLKPWSVNVLALEAGKFILENEEKIKPDEKELCNLSRELQQQINELEGFRVVGSQTGFFLVEMEAGKSADLKAYLLQEHGILIRDASNFRGLDEHFFRIGIQTKEKNVLLLGALKAYSRKKRPWNQPISSTR